MSEASPPSPPERRRTGGPPVPRFAKQTRGEVAPDAPQDEAPTVVSQIAESVTNAPSADQSDSGGGPRNVVLGGLLITTVALGALAYGVVSRSDRTDAAVPPATPAPPASADSGSDAPATAAPDAAEADATRTLEDHGLAYDVPEAGWSFSPIINTNDVRYTRRLTGPDGEVVRVIHTPYDVARPDPSFVERRSSLASSPASITVFVLRDFPVDECESTMCDDFVLNDASSFGGVAVLASDSDGPASQAAQAIAESVRPS